MKLALALASFLTLAQAADSAYALAGHWKGQGRILANWTTHHDLAVELLITPDGVVSGSIGDAQIASGRVESGSVIEVRLQGPLLRDDGIVREAFQLHLTPNLATLIGFGASDGNKSWPGASRESRLRSAKIQITRLVLEPVR